MQPLHLLLAVTPLPKEGISDGLLLERLGALDSPAFVAAVAKELAKDVDRLLEARLGGAGQAPAISNLFV